MQPTNADYFATHEQALKPAARMTSGEEALLLRASNKMSLHKVTADHDASEAEECFVDVVTAFAANAEAAELVQPTNRSFHHPAKDS